MLLPEKSHKRRNILTDEWVLVSPHRAKRPWQGQKETPATPEATYYDPSCYLCAGNKRANGTKNPLYKGTYVFTNDFAALNMDCETEGVREGLFQTQVEKGICRVVCFSEDHSKTLATMQVAEISAVVALWQTEYETLERIPILITSKFLRIKEPLWAVVIHTLMVKYGHNQVCQMRWLKKKKLKKTIMELGRKAYCNPI